MFRSVMKGDNTMTLLQKRVQWLLLLFYCVCHIPGESTYYIWLFQTLWRSLFPSTCAHSLLGHKLGQGLYSDFCDNFHSLQYLVDAHMEKLFWQNNLTAIKLVNKRMTQTWTEFKQVASAPVNRNNATESTSCQKLMWQVLPACVCCPTGTDKWQEGKASVLA